MKIGFIVKRHYSGQDLIDQPFGRYANLSAELSKLGHLVQVWALDFKRRPPTKMLRHGVQYNSLPHSTLSIRNNSLKALASEFAPDCIIAGGHVHFGILADRVKPKNCTLVFDIYDFYPAFLPKCLRPLASFLYKRSLALSDCLSIASPQIKETLATVANKRYAVVRNSIDIDAFNAPLTSPSVHRDSEYITVGYLGTIGSHVMIAETIEALSKLASEGFKIRLLHAGPTDKPPLPQAGLYQSIGNRPVSEIPSLLMSFDIAIAPYRNCEQVRYSNACKLSEFAAARSCAVVSRNGDWEYFTNKKYTGLFDPGKEGDLLEALRRQIKQRQPMEQKNDIGWRFETRKLDALINEPSNNDS